MKKTMAVMMLLAGGLMAAPRFTVGIGFGAPAPVAVVRPACPGPGYTWVDGYNGGYWAPPVVQVAPRYDNDNFHARNFAPDHFRGGDRDNARHFDRR